MDYIKLAVSKDKSRESLMYIYRDKDRLIATDGHRMHWKDSTLIDTPHYIDGYDGTFPEYLQVIPTKAPSYKVHLSLDRDQLNQLKKIRDLIKLTDKNCSVVFLFETSKISLIINQSGLRLYFDFTVTSITESVKLKLGFNLNYFIDAVEIPSKANKPLELELRGEFDPMLINSDIGTALVSPCRI